MIIRSFHVAPTINLGEVSTSRVFLTQGDATSVVGCWAGLEVTPGELDLDIKRFGGISL